MKQVNCTIPDCPNFGMYCRLHYGFTPQKEQKPIKAKSEKRAAIDSDLYYPAAKRFKKANPVCKLNTQGCTGATEDVHHTKGKATIELLLNEDFWLPACRHCNLVVEINDAEARQHDKKLSKFNNSLTNK